MVTVTQQLEPAVSGPAGTVRVSVRQLAELVWRRGDIHARYDSTTSAEEGTAAQRRLQLTRGEPYQREVPVSCQWNGYGIEVSLLGRVDGCVVEGDAPFVEEFKTTRVDPQTLHTHSGTVHNAQARLYAAMLADANPDQRFWEVRLVYVNPDTFATHVVAETLTHDQLVEFREHTISTFVRRVVDLREHRNRRDLRLRGTGFPYPSFRAPQYDLARQVYRALRDGVGLLVSAPTGTGKTMGTLFPALKSVCAGHADRLVYLTARGTGQRAIVEACGRLDAGLRVVAITAKAHVCLMERPTCDPEVCQFARGYYDRVEGAIEMLFSGGIATAERIEAVARAHTVCPFELSLDASVFADMVIGDYNYVIDPVVRLKRVHGFVGDRTALLVDEAHQLAPRARSALSCTLQRATVRAARGAFDSAGLERARAALERRFVELRRSLSTSAADGLRPPFEAELEKPLALLRAAERFFQQWAEASRRPWVVSSAGETLMFDVLRLLRAADWQDAERFRWVLRGSGSDIDLDLECVDPAAHISEVLNEFRGNVRFSATVEPLALFQRQHGDPEGRTIRVLSPFPAERLAVFVVPDVPVLYRHRLRGLDRLSDLIELIRSAHRGHYLVAFPSFEYLELACRRFEARNPGVRTLRQRPDMDAAARERYVTSFDHAAEPCVGFIVLGGVFAESIDLPGNSLSGIVVISAGLPPPSSLRDRIAARFGDQGADVAYRQPAMTRVVQAAGRLIRSETDRGVVCLVDPRYRSPEYRQYFPDHWQAETVASSALGSRLSEFWPSR